MLAEPRKIALLFFQLATLLTCFMQQGIHRWRLREIFAWSWRPASRKIVPWFLSFPFSAGRQGCSVRRLQLGAAVLSFHLTRKPAELHHFPVMLNSLQPQQAVCGQFLCFARWTEWVTTASSRLSSTHPEYKNRGLLHENISLLTGFSRYHLRYESFGRRQSIAQGGWRDFQNNA